LRGFVALVVALTGKLLVDAPEEQPDQRGNRISFKGIGRAAPQSGGAGGYRAWCAKSLRSLVSLRWTLAAL
jgi:hypothetical protein